MEPMEMSVPTELMNEPEPTEEDAKQMDVPTFVDTEIRDMILKRKEASRTFFQPRRERHDQCWNHYKQIYDTTNKEAWQSRTFVPASPKVAEVVAANMHSAVLAPDRPVEYQARQPIFEEPVRDVNDLISVDMEKSSFKIHETDILRSICIIGTGVGKVEYKKEYADVMVKERHQEMGWMATARRMLGLGQAPTETISVKRILVKDYACLKYVDRYDIFPEPGSTEISKDNWIIERGKICNYKLLELQNDPENPVINITPELLMNNPKRIGDPDGDKQEKDAALDELDKTTAYMDPDQEHELLEYWGPAPRWMVEPELYGDESRKYEMVHAWFWLIDGQYVVRRQVTPWRDAEPPYVKGVYIRVPGQWDGIGPLELMIGLQIELNELRNCRQDEINVKLSKPIAVLKDMVAKGEWGRLVSGPGALWVFENVDDIKKAFTTIDFDANMGDSWRASLEILNEIQEVTAAVKATVGTGGGDDQAGGGTFRGQLLNRQVASERFIMYARVYETTSLAAAYRKYYQRIYQFKGMEQIAQILGEERASKFRFVSPEELDWMAKIVPLGVTSMENKGVALAQMLEEFKTFAQFPWFKQLEAARRIVIQRGQSDPDSILMSDEELMQFNEQRRQLFAESAVPPGQPPMGGGPDGPPPGPISGDVPGPTDGLPQPAMPARGPGSSSIDVMGRPAA